MDGNDTARAVYLTLLGAALVVGLFAMYRDRLGEALQNAAIWGLIFVGAILAYAFSDEVMQALDPRAAVARDDGSILLERAPDGHFHARLEVEGVPVEFLVDTGATEMVLSRRDAASIGLDPDALAYTQRAMTANGVVRGAPVRLSRVVFAGYERRDVRAVVNGGALDVSLLGMSYLDGFTRIEIEGDRLRLVR